MEPEQRARMADVMDRLTDVVLRDADPDSWTAPGKTLKAMTKEERGDAAWCRKTACMSVSLLLQFQRLHQQAEQEAPAGDVAPSLDEELAAAEVKARALLERVGAR